jgi:hypothetical protein
MFDIRDSYKLIAQPLASLPSFLGTKLEKEIYPYEINRIENTEKEFLEWSEVNEKWMIPHIKKVCIEQNLVDFEEDLVDSFPWMDYSEYYCERDCDVLYEVLDKLDDMLREYFSLSITTRLTISSLADLYMHNQGVYCGVYNLSGNVRKFI